MIKERKYEVKHLPGENVHYNILNMLTNIANELSDINVNLSKKKK